jgi:hypothetical protein
VSSSIVDRSGDLSARLEDGDGKRDERVRITKTARRMVRVEISRGEGQVVLVFGSAVSIYEGSVDHEIPLTE